ncbi:MAG: hypothetical protein AB8B55_12800 [Mariniblastus sp.]
MTLQTIDIPDEVRTLPHTPDAARLIDLANERIESLMLADESITENFIPCDFHLLDQSLTWIEENQLLKGCRFCELGSGLGAAALLASLREMACVGIEIDSALVDQANRFAGDLELSAKFYCGSFVPREIPETVGLGRKVEIADPDVGDVYEKIGLEFGDFDLFFAFPWPGDLTFFEALFEECASVNSMLLTYHGGNGMKLIRKS